jgi:hypothetical protein
VFVDEVITVLQVKQGLQAQIGAPISEQVLISRESVCRDDKELVERVLDPSRTSDCNDFHLVLYYPLLCLISSPHLLAVCRRGLKSCGPLKWTYSMRH